MTTTHEDYLETTLHLQRRLGPDRVRITDIANALGTRLPTVSRTVRRLTELGLISHQVRGVVRLTERGRTVAQEIDHRHNDLVAFFRRVLGLSAEVAESDTCQIEHGLSAISAQRLHEFMEFFQRLGAGERELFARFQRQAGDAADAFNNLPDTRTAGWRK
ncbi:MAG TPA: metal-dependent transcriptional regulator [candidate division Zixibacteria bacterium]|nr:metal-dependent transcriptional regulator [candidate division Zixibacteria bacterium]